MSIVAKEAVVPTDKIVEKLMSRVSKDQVKKLVDAATATSGRVIGNALLDPDGELCPVIHFPFPFPPRFDQFLNEAAVLGKLHLFPYGVIALEGVLVQVAVKNMQL